jgi:hypothetical protein
VLRCEEVGNGKMHIISNLLLLSTKSEAIVAFTASSLVFGDAHIGHCFP